MAKKTAPKDREKHRDRTDREPSRPTGLFWPCPANPLLHAAMPLALRIMRGPRSHHIECGACKTRALLAPGIWKETQGMTPQQALSQGLTIL